MTDPYDPPASLRRRWAATTNPWLLVPAGLLLGLILFLAIWLAGRGSDGESDSAVLPAAAPAHAPRTAPLPAPQPPDAATAAGAPDGGGSVFVLPDTPGEPGPLAGTTDMSSASHGGDPAAADAAAPGAAGDRPPVPTHSPAPTYPARALRSRLSGQVVVQALVGVDGRPRQVDIAHSSSHRILDQAALRSVRRWRFQPAIEQGRPVAQAVNIPIEFDQR